MTTRSARACYLLDEALERIGERRFGNLWRGADVASRSIGGGADHRARYDDAERRLLDALARGEIIAGFVGSEGNAFVPAAYWRRREARAPSEPRGYSIELSQLMPLKGSGYHGPSTVGIAKEAFDKWLRTLERAMS